MRVSAQRGVCPDTPPVNRITDRCKNIIFPQLLLRAVIISLLHFRYGERLLKLEDISLAAIKEMVDEWKTLNGKPFDPQQSVHDVTSKIITSLVSRNNKNLIAQQTLSIYASSLSDFIFLANGYLERDFL